MNANTMKAIEKEFFKMLYLTVFIYMWNIVLIFVVVVVSTLQVYVNLAYINQYTKPQGTTAKNVITKTKMRIINSVHNNTSSQKFRDKLTVLKNKKRIDI